MRENNSIAETKRIARDINPVLITVILSVLVIIPQYLLGLLTSLARKSDLMEGVVSFIENNDLFFLLIVYNTALTLILAYMFARKILKRTDLSLGLVDDNKLKSYAKGILLGFSLLTIIILILKFTGFAQIDKNPKGFDLKFFLIFVPAWMIQGFEEEFLLRGILMNQMAARSKIILGIIANSIIFSVFHLGNAGFDLMASVNIFLIGLVFSLIFYLTDSIYIVAAFHSIWNMAMANIYGITVSGNSPTEVTLLNTIPRGAEIMTGGSFGLEASIITSLVLGVVLIYLIIKIKKKDLVI